MFKRANKITALLVAAASVMSIVPAMAADSTRLGTKDGTIEKAIAFNGKYIYEGYKGDTDKAVYFNGGEKDKELTDYTDYDFKTSTYGEKYALAEDNNEDYLVDLTSGSITDETLDDKLDNTASKLQKALTKTDKYDGATIGSSDLKEVKSSAKFQTPWYYVNNAQTKNKTIFTDANGKYIDASVLANIYAFSTTKGKVVKVEKFDKEYSDTALKVEIAKQPQVIAQDKDNLYAMVNVNITDTATTVSTDAAAATATVDLSNAKYALQNAVTAAQKATITPDFASVTTGTAVTVAGHAFAASDNATAAGFKTAVADYFIANPISGYAYNRTAAKFEATTAGVVVDSKIPTYASGDICHNKFVNGTNEIKATSAGVQPTITIGTKVFEYTDSTHGVTAGTHIAYTDATSLKNAIIAAFASGVTTVGTNTYTFDSVNLKFTATSANKNTLTADDVESDLKTVIGKSGNTTANGSKVTNAWYLQKISKAQGDTDEEAYEPKSVTSYQIDNKSLYDDGDAKDAYEWLLNNGEIANLVHVQVKDNSLYAYKLDDNDTVKTYKLNLKQVKKDPIDKTVFGTTKLDGYVVEKDGDADQDFENANGNALDVDVNGVLWALNDGKIVKFDGKDKTTVYTCDSGFDQISVYDAKNLIAWSYDDERYTTVSEGTAVTQSESTAVAPVIKTNWDKNADGTWSFYDQTGAKVVSKWINVGGAWYYLKADGIMATGWYQDGATWYYLNPSSGAMATGWLNDNGTWYYLAGSGAMLANTTVDGYQLGASGAWIK
jgi:hypothetical protein